MNEDQKEVMEWCRDGSSIFGIDKLVSLGWDEPEEIGLILEDMRPFIRDELKKRNVIEYMQRQNVALPEREGHGQPPE